ncbi:excinuclease ABC subunit UvrC [Sedimenticola selenatireducens]|uniref:UvrABC system protein C n=1 Tax=Sedimenticola selenatireducens TaxID=191960 RepID=A0A557S7S6_9GAMM|nr:excinuclease ABC subunit UvrC [Sedimenticola selenatireducens]TVO73476.1 excinuclease ABC subunit UvrC [Sedimenticola selenatireducens]TVT63417.1 MAG: excinuclease ABC subunit UvrC [Sedimenticola selenatireducens]
MALEHGNTFFDHKHFLKSLTRLPGVYRMMAGDGSVLYVGKAKDLKRRVSSYFTRAQNRRIQLMVAKIQGIEVTVTHTEAEALILENNLIKSLKPKYNILLRDDKSYPYIYLSADEFPRLAYHRGKRKAKGRFFGPYPNAGSMRETLQLLQKLFPVRQCDDSFYSNRSRPCLQYQIKRCSAPCVGFISEEAYAEDVKDAVLFLEGRTAEVIDGLVARMEKASSVLAFEQAARLRDQIAALSRIQEKQYITGERGDLDIIACSQKGGSTCIQLFLIRHGRNLGNKAFFPNTAGVDNEGEILSAFITQYYLGKQIPAEIIVSHPPDDRALLEEVLSLEAGRQVNVRQKVRANRAQWLRMAMQNAMLALDAKLASKAGMRDRLEALQRGLNLDDTPSRMECFDISHTSGELTVASCVVFDSNGPLKTDYRRFNIEGIQGGDDYAAMTQALTRRYTRIQSGEGVLPDILFIDGGKGQLHAAANVLEELAIVGVLLVGVAKGPDRRAGMEQLFLLGEDLPIILPADSPALHLIQQIRDEAHRFAITGHRQRRNKSRKTSVLEQISGIGAKRRQGLLKHFGGIQGIARAGIIDLERVEGISRTLAEQIYAAFHEE